MGVSFHFYPNSFMSMHGHEQNVYIDLRMHKCIASLTHGCLYIGSQYLVFGIHTTLKVAWLALVYRYKIVASMTKHELVGMRKTGERKWEDDCRGELSTDSCAPSSPQSHPAADCFTWLVMLLNPVHVPFHSAIACSYPPSSCSARLLLLKLAGAAAGTTDRYINTYDCRRQTLTERKFKSSAANPPYRNTTYHVLRIRVQKLSRSGGFVCNFCVTPRGGALVLHNTTAGIAATSGRFQCIY
jgi:hypothetical protein